MSEKLTTSRSTEAASRLVHELAPHRTVFAQAGAVMAERIQALKAAVARVAMLIAANENFRQSLQNAIANAAATAFATDGFATDSRGRNDAEVSRGGRIATSDLEVVVAIYLKDANLITKLRRIINDPDMSIGEKLWRLDETLPIPDEMTAAELAHVFRVTRQAVSKTSWWKQRRRRPDDVDERLQRLRIKGQNIDPDSFDDDAALAG